MERQSEPLAPPLQQDQESLTDYTAVVQRNLENLFEVAHRHHYRTTAPTSNEGDVGDVYLVESGSTFSLYVKFPSGWKSTVLT